MVQQTKQATAVQRQESEGNSSQVKDMHDGESCVMKPHNPLCSSIHNFPRDPHTEDSWVGFQFGGSRPSLRSVVGATGLHHLQ